MKSVYNGYKEHFLTGRELKEFFDKCSDIEKVKYYMGFVSLCAFISYFHIGDCMEEIREDSGFKKYTMVLGHENL